MALRYRNRVSQVTTTSGTTLSVNLGDVRSGFFAFYNAGDPEDTDTLVEGDTFGYLMQSVSNRAILEIGIGTMTSPTTFTRGEIESSSNGGALVDFPSGTKHVSLIMTAAQMAETSRAIVLADLPAINFSNLVGSASVAQIPGLPASKITSETFDLARIPTIPSTQVSGNFAASRIDSGVFDVARIPSLPYLTGPLSFADLTGQASLAQLPATIPLTQIGAISFTDVSGTATAAQIPSLDAAKIVTGVFADSLIPSLAASKITSGIFTGARGGLGADASAFSGVLKMAAGVASVAVAGTDYATPASALASAVAAMAAGTNPVSATTIAGSTATFSSNAIFGPAGAALGDARVVVNEASSGKGMIVKLHATPGNPFEVHPAASSTALAGFTSAGGLFATTLMQFLNGANTGNLTYNTNGTLEYTSTSSGIILSVTGAVNPQVRITDTTNTVVAKIQSLDSSAIFGTETLHSFEIRSNNTGRMTVGANGGFTITDANDFAFGTTTGTKIGTSVSQKIGLWNATPVVQPASAAQAVVATTAATQTTPYGFSTQAQADGIITLLNEIRRSLVLTGLMKGSA
jgi:hypothetical protein